MYYESYWGSRGAERCAWSLGAGAAATGARSVRFGGAARVRCTGLVQGVDARCLWQSEFWSLHVGVAAGRCARFMAVRDLLVSCCPQVSFAGVYAYAGVILMMDQ